MTFLDGKVYTASYAGGDITRYDPEQTWDQWNHKNPQPVAKVGPAYIRPTGGICVGPGGRIYSGWMAKYGTYGGAVAITDPATGQTELLENPLGDQAIVGLAADDAHLYVGTSFGANGLANKAGELPSFGVIDPVSNKVRFRHTFEGASSVGPVVYDTQSSRVAVSVNGRLNVYVPAAGAFANGLVDAAPPVSSQLTATGRWLRSTTEMVPSCTPWTSRRVSQPPSQRCRRTSRTSPSTPTA